MYKWVVVSHKNGLITARGSYNVSNLARLKRRIKRRHKIEDGILIYRRYDKRGKPLSNWEFVGVMHNEQPQD